ncbi:exodeoxyribonuclease V subunit gamma [Avibacterium paragallinarum]|uniref:RecBCD enzyme subunit RecC n=1 Tax=Avibacterium paragallinarum TaxID=728 RepID=A0A377I5B9_AVIPA|nr:exodeoxyribonuclease V subunit gamma [Avibacterium paragallinarum]POY46627.1 exodeoxyribonuclease V subunit gamma [Avibacterium paragallinarum]RZN76225.1 exodeoxyribonuclease V subunit gamma [Avibacterium paragallinarum]STO70361.1 DNA helicase/exodeoxyribonuclease V subunit gamma [Avibacterium paragallinarum]
MFTVYYSNLLEVQKEILLHLMTREPLADHLQSEVILVQSPGMAQWLQWQIADKQGISANLQFPMPSTFIWQLYRDNLLDISQQNQFSKEQMVWRLMRLIPQHLSQQAFSPLRHYLRAAPQSVQQKQYQLAEKVADLFDQYLVYRPDWINAWEQGDNNKIIQQILSQHNENQGQLVEQIEQHIEWQGILWRALIAEIQQENQNETRWHRASLHQRFLQLLAQKAVVKLPKRIFVFGISALPKVYLEILKGISEFCEVHLFFTNPCREYWGDIVDRQYWQKLQLRSRIDHQSKQSSPLFSSQQLTQLNNAQYEYTAEQELLQVGNPLLASWGKQGRDFLYLLTELQGNEINAYVERREDSLLHQIQQRILTLTPTGTEKLALIPQDASFSLHACYSAMREVEVLQDYLLHLFNQDSSLTPKDVVVMVADIDKYTPYIRAVFGQGEPHIPYSISDNKIVENNVIVSAFLKLLALKESLFTAQDVLDFLDIPSIRSRFNIELEDLPYIHHWVKNSGIRFGLEKYVGTQQDNYNAWKAGLERMLLGYAMREENGIWQDSLGFDNSYGLKGQLAGYLAELIEQLYQWHQTLCMDHPIEKWQQALSQLVETFFHFDETSQETQWYLTDCIERFIEPLMNVKFTQPLCAEVVVEALADYLQENPNNLRFLAGKVNFCTLLPMRSIPFRVVCLLGMNEGEYPRQTTPNSFDLMQYHHQKGDRFKRDDDRYLFLEALVSAQDYFYLSYVGHSIIDDAPKEPSVLVNQLIDYIAENLVSDEEPSQPDSNEYWRNKLITHHPMTAFSEKNFEKNHRTFSHKWLPLVNKTIQDELGFIQPLNNLTQIKDVELTQLIRFVQHPVKFFLEQVLGVYLKNDELALAETENFSLDHLELFHINQTLLYLADDELADFFAQLKIKGIMPRGNFAQVYEQQISQNILGIKEQVAEYLTKESISVPIDLSFNLSTQTLILNGVLDKLYPLANGLMERVTWRVGGKIRDKDLIENWIYYLVQCATQENVAPSHSYAKGEQVRFKILPKSTALTQLQCYLEAYVQAQQSPCLVLTTNLSHYFKALKNEKGTDDEEAIQQKCFAILYESIYGNDYGFKQEDKYWQRVLSEQELVQLDLNAMSKTMQDWFGLMLESCE